MCEKYSFLEDESSDDNADLESLIGLKKIRPKRSKVPPKRYRDQMKEVMEESSLEEAFSMYTICDIIYLVM